MKNRCETVRATSVASWPRCSCRRISAQGSGAVRAPLIQWSHSGASSSSTGGAFYTGTTYPAQFQGAYFYGDYSRSFIRTARVDSSDALTSGPTDFAGTADGPVDFGIGPGGDLYYLAINTGELSVWRVIEGRVPSGDDEVAFTTVDLSGREPRRHHLHGTGR